MQPHKRLSEATWFNHRTMAAIIQNALSEQKPHQTAQCCHGKNIILYSASVKVKDLNPAVKSNPQAHKGGGNLVSAAKTNILI